MTRATFAAILKLSEKTESFRNFQDEVEHASYEVGNEFTGAKRLIKIIEKLKEFESKELQPMMNKWETSTEIRRWFNDKKS